MQRGRELCQNGVVVENEGEKLGRKGAIKGHSMCHGAEEVERAFSHIF